MELFELIKTLNAAHGPSGDEGGIQEVIAQLAAPFADEVTADTLGNLIVRKRGEGPKVMFAAHMEKADFGKLKLDECYLDIGAKDEETAKTMVQVGDTAVYDSPIFQTGTSAVSPYLDNRISCAVLLKVLEQVKQSPNDLYFVFTAQEEVGIRGGRTAAWGVDPAYGIAIDVTDVDDTPGSEKSGTVGLGKGAAIKVMDSSVICHPEVVSKLEELAREQGIPTQRDILRAGGTDAGAIHITRTGVKTGGISVPCRYIHTPVEMADLTDTQHCVQLAAAFAQCKLEG